MQEAPGSSQLARVISPETIVQLAGLYDRAVNALDPHSLDRAEAERLLNEELRRIFDEVVGILRPQPPLEFRDFKRTVIVRCKKHLQATDHPSTT